MVVYVGMYNLPYRQGINMLPNLKHTFMCSTHQVHVTAVLKRVSFTNNECCYGRPQVLWTDKTVPSKRLAAVSNSTRTKETCVLGYLDKVASEC